ncbi:hypothetical protein KY360_06750 [Candidatus Woesearchaeota archaeon]|nr:hypothetical protein [Candidatus Woesearchaeota archaeon]
MAEVTAFRGILLFFDKIGVYDVVLPFLLVFAILFAILEKTKVLGIEKIEGKEYTKKNLNAMVAFVISFLVIASSRIVEIITTVSAQVVVLLMASVLFLLLVGSFFKEEGASVFLEGSWRVFFMLIMFIGILLIFMNALGWLDDLWGWISRGTGGNAVGSIVLIVIVIFFMWFVVKTPEQKPAVKKE